MSVFNKFTAAFDKAASRGDADGAARAMVKHVKAHSNHTKQSLAESFSVVRAWMNYDMGGNREASERNTETGQKAIEAAKKTLSIT